MTFIIDIFKSYVDIPYISFVFASLTLNCLIRFSEKIERNAK